MSAQAQMHNFSRALAAYLDGPPARRQDEFAEKARVNRAKVCRLIKNQISCDRETLDGVLTAVPEPEARRELVKAYIQDMASPGALLHLKTNAQGLWDGFDFNPLSAKEQAALKKILTGPGAKTFGKLVVDLSEALG